MPLRRSRPPWRRTGGFRDPRRKIILANTALRERESDKRTAIAGVVAGALRKRGVEVRRADLAAQVGVAALGHAFDAWYNSTSLGLAACLDRAFAELGDLVSPLNDRM